MYRYRNVNVRKRERIATLVLWLLLIVCTGYIFWKINPDPIHQGIGWTKKQTEQFLDQCEKQALMQTLPVFSNFFLQETWNNEETENATSNTISFTNDPFYQKYLSFHQPGDG